MPILWNYSILSLSFSFISHPGQPEQPQLQDPFFLLRCNFLIITIRIKAIIMLIIIVAAFDINQAIYPSYAKSPCNKSPFVLFFSGLKSMKRTISATAIATMLPIPNVTSPVTRPPN